MNTEQLRAEFEAWAKDNCVPLLERVGYAYFMPDETITVWNSYQAAAKSRDELIGKLVGVISDARKLLLNGTIPLILMSAVVCALEQALAEAKAQGYRE